MIDRGRPRVLSVDDEPAVLQVMARSLKFRGTVDIETATNGHDGLRCIEEMGPFAVIISDLRMPEMDGVEFLSRVRDVAPDSVRILLTGDQDFHSAVNAVNSGHVFRFLTKPCPTPHLLNTVDQAVDQYKLLTGERVLLKQTLRGCVRTLTEILSLVSPEAFARANRIKEIVTKLSEVLSRGDDWQIELAAMLSQIGCVTLPPEVAARLYHGESLPSADASMVARLPGVAAKLLENIPRLEEVRAIIENQNKRFDSGDSEYDYARGGEIPLGSRLLKVAADFDLLLSKTGDASLALGTMKQRQGWYDPTVLDAMATILGNDRHEEHLEEVRLSGLRPGMILDEDVRTHTGLLVLGRGQVITEGVKERIINLTMRMSVVEPIRVRVKTKQPAHVGAV